MDKSKRIYISGPMTDPSTGRVSEVNLAAFREAERMLRKDGCTRIVNPVNVWACKFPRFYRTIERIVGSDWAYRLILLYDLFLLLRCRHIYKIPGWRESRGANIESCVAFWFKIYCFPQRDVATINRRLAKLMEKYNRPKTNREE